jgi:hypothetical protein
MHSTKLTKYFQVNKKDPLFFFPEKDSSVPPIINEVASASSPSNTHSAFDIFSVHLVTFYQECTQTMFYGLVFPSRHQYDIFSKIDKCESSQVGELKALLKSLQYIVYHPSLFQKLNKYKVVISTTSEYISTIITPEKINLSIPIYFKIQSLLQCIKQFNIEHSNKLKESFERLKNEYRL